MKKTVLFLLAILNVVAFAQLPNTSKWYTVNNYDEGAWCANATQAASGGLLTLTAASGSFACGGHSHIPYDIGMVVSSPFYFQYGTVKAVIKFPGRGVHSVFWLWGGAPGTSGYPPVCVSSIKHNPAGYMGVCTADANPAYEIDIAEFMPASLGLTYIENNAHTWINGSTTAGSVNDPNVGVNLTAGFHTYELDWTPTKLTFKLDGKTTSTIQQSINVPMFLILDEEIDVNGGKGSYPLQMQVRSVDVWDRNNNLIFTDHFGSVR